MGAWVIDIYATRSDKAPIHRALAQGDTEEDALLAASKHYRDDELVVSVGKTSAMPTGHHNSVLPLW